MGPANYRRLRLRHTVTADSAGWFKSNSAATGSGGVGFHRMPGRLAVPSHHACFGLGVTMLESES